MECDKSVKSIKNLNTKECCLFCLQSEVNHQPKHISEKLTKSVSIQSLLHHLHIPVLSENSPNSSNKDILAELCESCTKIILRFLVLFQQLEKIQIEMSYLLETIHCCISTSKEDSSRVQNYSNRMTSDSEALMQLSFVDNLRKELVNKCLSETMKSPQLFVNLTRISAIKIKEEGADYNDEEIFEDSACETFDHAEDEFYSSNCQQSQQTSKESSLPEVKIEPECTSASVMETQPEQLSLTKEIKTKRNGLNVFYTRNSSTGMYQCTKCTKILQTDHGMSKHYKTVHLKTRYKCDVCNSVFTQIAHLTVHKKKCQENIEAEKAKDKDPRFKFICVCGKRFDTKMKLRSHRIYMHTNTNRYKCDLCDKTFTKMSNLKKHKDGVHLGIEFYCRFCNVKRRYKSNLKNHEKICAKKVESRQNHILISKI